MKRPEHIIDPMPRGARCAERGCREPATTHRLLGELVLMQDGTIHEAVEWVCERHQKR